MIEVLLSMTGVFASVGIGAGVYYKLGRLEQKMDFLYQSCDINITFKKPEK